MKTYELNGKQGSWIIIGKTIQENRTYYLMENLIYRDMVPQVIVDEKMNVVIENTWDGFLALEELELTK